MVGRENISPSSLEWSWPASSICLPKEQGRRQPRLSGNPLAARRGVEQSIAQKNRASGTPKRRLCGGQSCSGSTCLFTLSIRCSIPQLKGSTSPLATILFWKPHPWMVVLKRDWDVLWSLECAANNILSLFSHGPGKHPSLHFVHGETESAEIAVIHSVGTEELKFEFRSKSRVHVFFFHTTKFLFHCKLGYTWQEK